jgi:uncharacterized protein with FMN-binding domain
MKSNGLVACLRVLGFVMIATSAGGCASYFTRPSVTVGYTEFGTSASTAAPEKGSTVMEFAAVKFADELYKSANDSSNDTLARNAVIAGRSLLNLRCSDYLDQIGLKNQRAANERRHVDIVGGFASAIMGLTGSSAKSIAAVASSFSFAGSSLDSAGAAFLFSDASKAINRLVRDAQEKYVAKLNDYEGSWTYADAVDILTGYEELCRPTSIRALVDEAIANTRLVAEDPANGNGSGKSLASQVVGQLQAGLVNKAVNERDAIALYDWYANPDERKAIESTAPFKEMLSRLGLKPVEVEAKVAPAFAAVIKTKSSPLLARWGSDLDAAKAARSKSNGTTQLSPATAAPPASKALFVRPSIRVQRSPGL